MENPMMSGMSWPEANTGKIRRHVDMRSLIIDRNRQNQNVSWKDNQGNEGEILRNSFHNQESYYPVWIQEKMK